MKQTGEMVYLIEDDLNVRNQLLLFLASAEFEVMSFESATEFLAYVRSDTCACLIVEMEMKDINGLELQRRIGPKVCPPIIFISELGSVQLTVTAMKAGAIEFLTRPICVPALYEAIERAFVRDRILRRKRACVARLQERLSLLTPREREVLPLVVGGLLNKQAAALLNISEVTLQIHRSQIMRKMAAGSFADLVRMAVELRIPHWQPPFEEQQRA